ncbi:CoA transferase [Aquamicrobium sp. NLF2-7]|uniref:Crotonobetainyl-CoA:carnitine CoA-transferase CaiB-like acyl-CoA transferase n=1 Tax=Aquamicrobium lusatiense TaxID=89772 RepID=A0A7W9VX00_9HYPH|nr:crotonobetainyl-CoA:carnitine CoA-transferase CaiB-like acyl-CoA transferase [Aquamicrobium lusatiense]MCG8273769.1 CoA transferase [Aquamicrobium sp. NLF2-7]
MSETKSSATAPLAGVKVVEFCHVAAGPFCSMLLADMGADVIKVESPDGDTMRQWPPHSDGFSENFASLNRNKRSIALDLKNPADNAIAVRLIGEADVVVENNRPGAMQRLGLSYDRFAQEMPSLIYCSLSAYGQDGPRAGEGGFDLTVQAMSGIMSVTGNEGGEPVKCGIPISDFATGLYAAFSIASLLTRVRQGCKGGYIDVSMLGASLAIAALQTSEYFASGRDPRALGAAHPRNAPYEAFTASDGSFVLAAGNDRLWRSVCEVVGRPDLFEDERFVTTIDRARNQKELARILNGEFARRTVAELLEDLRRAGVPCSSINSYSQALSDIQVEHMGWVREMALPNGVHTRTFASPVRIDGQSPPIYKAPPALDEHGESIRRSLLTPAI